MGQLLATYDIDSGGALAQHFMLSDHLGTRRMQTDASGTPEQECQSLPYGDSLNCAAPANAPATEDDANPLRFTGKQRDVETGGGNSYAGNDYFGARYYASSMGRFMSPDHSEDETIPVALPFAELTNPQTFNLYSYVENNPLSFVDPDGHAHWQNCDDGSGSQCLVGDSNGEANQQNGRTVYWNAAGGYWDNNDPTKMNDGRINDLIGGQLLTKYPPKPPQQPQ
jgi:RHS repeat-associated protein